MPNIPDVVILCGGAGMRLRSITGAGPKTMASIAGRPFIELLLLQLKRHGFSRVILSVGYQAQVIRDHLGDRAFGLELLYSLESSPLGTGGALGQAANLITTESALVMNGDSYTDVDLGRLVLTHRKDKADLTVVVVPDSRSDAGSVLLDHQGRIIAFAEKRVVQSSCYRSAGVYMFRRELAGSIPAAVQSSLEDQLFPRWIEEDRQIRAFVHPGKCIDIGTPERYRSAQDILASVEREESAPRCESRS
jgi:NDP-sugar pyrophosphorylase family protein